MFLRPSEDALNDTSEASSSDYQEKYNSDCTVVFLGGDAAQQSQLTVRLYKTVN